MDATLAEMRFQFPPCTCGSDDPGPDEVCLVGDEDDGVAVDDLHVLEVVEDALGRGQALLVVHRVHNHVPVRVVRRHLVLDL